MKKTNCNAFFLLVLAFGLSTACTKKVPYEEVVKLEVEGKDMINENEEYLYNAKQTTGSRWADDSFPHRSANNKRVMLKFTENALLVTEKDSDARFSSNPTNTKTVLEIPVEHLDYQCSKNQYKECTNKEEVNNEVKWDKKKFFKLKADGLKSAQFELLPVQMESELSGCYKEISARLVGEPTFEKGEAINIEIERTYQVNLYCLNSRNLSDSNIKVRYHYSMVKVKSVLSKDFKVKNYSDLEERSYGFFSTEKFPLDTDYNETQSGRQLIMNHWNPNRTSIEYYLSDEFKKPENAFLADLTKQTVNNINLGLNQAGVKFRINLHDPAGKNPGDIRNSMIVLVEDPSAASVIGYGPQVEDPLTGEIISAKTVMYLGAIKQYLKYTYEDIIRMEKQKSEKSKSDKLEETKNENSSGGKSQQSLAKKYSAQLHQVADNFLKSKEPNYSKDVLYSKLLNIPNPIKVSSLTVPSKKSFVSSSSAPFNSQNLDSLNFNKAVKAALKYTSNVDKSYSSLVEGTDLVNFDLKFFKGIPGFEQIEAISLEEFNKKSQDLIFKRRAYTYLQRVKNCSFTPDFVKVSEKVTSEILKTIGKDLPSWESLSPLQKDKVIAIILPEIWIPTLIHEMGHNLGLRHNFEGSEDKEGFYSPEELQSIGETERLPESNSVMEYIDDLRALRHLGKYDISALKFAYSKIATVNGTVQVKPTVSVTVPLTELRSDISMDEAVKTLRDNLGEKYGIPASERESKISIGSPYKYCTDEHAGINAGCYRFDYGTSKTEIVKNLINSYQQLYEIRNFRRDKADFSLYSDHVYAARISSIFYDLRLMMEVVERFKNLGIPYTDKIWEKDSFLNDLRTAAALGGQAMMDVIKTPDILCVLVGPTGKLEVAGKYEFPSGVKDCWSVELNSNYKMIAQSEGKSFNSFKLSDSPNHFADQIDVRGYWIDKMLAVKYLLRRQVNVSSLDGGGENYADLPELRAQMSDILTGVSRNSLTTKMKFQFLDGSAESIEMPLNTADGFIVKKPIHPYISWALGVPFAEFNLSNLITRYSARAAVDHISKVDSQRDFADQFKVFSFDRRTGSMGIDESFSVLDVGYDRFVASPENTVAQELIKRALHLQLEDRVVKSVDSQVVKALLEYRKLQQEKSSQKAKDSSAGTINEDTGEVQNPADGSGSENPGEGTEDKPSSELEILVKGIESILGRKLQTFEVSVINVISTLESSALEMHIENSEIQVLNNDFSVITLRTLPMN